jgi:hypothetical protein
MHLHKFRLQKPQGALLTKLKPLTLSEMKQFHNYNQPKIGQYPKQVTFPTKLLWQALHHKSLTLP